MSRWNPAVPLMVMVWVLEVLRWEPLWGLGLGDLAEVVLIVGRAAGAAVTRDKERTGRGNPMNTNTGESGDIPMTTRPVLRCPEAAGAEVKITFSIIIPEPGEAEGPP